MKEMATLLKQYYPLMERYCRRYMLYNHLAFDVVKEAFENLYEEGKLVATPGLRAVLQQTTKAIWMERDRRYSEKEAWLTERMQRYLRLVERAKQKQVNADNA